MPLLRDDVGADHEAARKDRTRKIAREKERAHREPAGGRRIDHHIVGGRNQHPLDGGRDRHRGRKVHIVAAVHHHGNLERTERGRVRRRGAGDPSEEVGGDDVHHREPAGHPAHTGVRQIKELLGDPTGPHQDSHGDEKGHRHEGEGGNSLDHLLTDRGQILPLIGEAEDCGKRDGIGDRKAKKDHDEKAEKKHHNRGGIGIHYSPSFR